MASIPLMPRRRRGSASLLAPRPPQAAYDDGGGNDGPPAAPSPAASRGRAPRLASADPEESGDTIAPLAGSMGGGVPPAPAAPLLSPARMENALANQSAADFARAAPGPATDKASAYGSVQASDAAKNAYANRQANRANLQSGNFFQGQELTQDANARQNLIAPKRAEYLGSLAERNNAEGYRTRGQADVVDPSTARANDAHSAVGNANAKAIGDTTPSIVAENNAAAAERNAQAQNITGGGAAAQANLADVHKRLTASESRVKQLESLLARQRDGQGNPIPLPGPDAANGQPAATPTPPAAAPQNVTYPPPPAPVGGAVGNAARALAPRLPGGTPNGGVGRAVNLSAPQPPAAAAAAAGRPLDDATAQQILDSVGGDKDRARAIARSRGFTIN